MPSKEFRGCFQFVPTKSFHPFIPICVPICSKSEEARKRGFTFAANGDVNSYPSRLDLILRSVTPPLVNVLLRLKNFCKDGVLEYLNSKKELNNCSQVGIARQYPREWTFPFYNGRVNDKSHFILSKDNDLLVGNVTYGLDLSLDVSTELNAKGVIDQVGFNCIERTLLLPVPTHAIGRETQRESGSE